jgi:hypothetical protein
MGLGHTMRAKVRASAAIHLLARSALLAACAQSPRPLPPHDPPARALAVTLERVTLRASAYLELDADLGAGAAEALAACEDERCARAAVQGSPEAAAYEAALPSFDWTPRVETASRALDAARAALSRPEIEPLYERILGDLAIEPRDASVAVPVVTREARGPCFATSRHIADCLLVRAAVVLAPKSALFAALSGELPHAQAKRAWESLAIHAVGATLRAWWPAHRSPMRGPAGDARLVSWLAQNWGPRARGESVGSFASRYAAEVRVMGTP